MSNYYTVQVFSCVSIIKLCIVADKCHNIVDTMKCQESEDSFVIFFIEKGLKFPGYLLSQV